MSILGFSAYCVKSHFLLFALDLTFFFFKKFFFNFFIYYYFFLLYNIVLDLPYINMYPPRVYTYSLSWTHLPPPSQYHPSGSSQCTSPKLPVSCIEPGLAIRFLYDIIHVLMPFSQIIPPSLSHRVEKTILYICVSFAVSHRVRILILLFQSEFLLFLFSSLIAKNHVE